MIRRAATAEVNGRSAIRIVDNYPRIPPRVSVHGHARAHPCRCCGAGREPRWLTDTLLRTLAELHADGWAHSFEVPRRDTLVGGAIRIGIGDVISGDSLFGRHQDAARVALADMAAGLEEAGGLLIDTQWDSPFLRSIGAEPVPREDYLPLLGHPAERIALPSRPRPARRLLGPG
jgi:leucyl/phenylalanyl-tRNA--protein transferase